jgi:hypothetical protein
MEKQTFNNFKERVEFVLWGDCTGCLEDEWRKRFLRSCLEDIGVIPEIFNLIAERLFPNKYREIIFENCGAITRWCGGVYRGGNFFETIEMVLFDEVYEKQVLEINNRAGLIRKEIESMNIKAGQVITVEMLRDERYASVKWLIFSMVSSSGIIKGYEINKDLYRINREAALNDAKKIISRY